MSSFKALSNEAIGNALSVCEKVLEEEERRLKLALLVVKESMAKIKYLKDKKEELMKAKEEVE
jgi:hypothetical protein